MKSLEILQHVRMAMSVMYHKLVETGAINSIDEALLDHGVPKDFSVKFEELIEAERKKGE